MTEIILIVGTACTISAAIGWKLKELTDAYYQNAPHWGFDKTQMMRDNDWMRERYGKEFD